MTTEATCPKCSAPLLLDRTSVIDLAADALVGARYYCRANGADVWQIAKPEPVPAAPVVERFGRSLRPFVCIACRCPGFTRGTRTMRCPACLIDSRRERERRRHLRRSAAKRAARAVA